MTMSRIRTWYMALRPFSYTASVIPVLVGTVLVGYETGHIDIYLFLATLIASVSVLAGTNLADEYFDHLRGVDKEGALGFKRVLKQRLLTPNQVLAAGLIFWATAVILGLYIVQQAGLAILVIALLSMTAALLYAAGPLGHFGLGEMTVFIFMGPVMVMGSYFVQSGAVTWDSFWVSLPIACMVAAILQGNNIRDIDEDRASGKRTLATFIGRKRANIEYYVLLSGAYIALGIMTARGIAPWTALLTLATLPTAISMIRAVRDSHDALALTGVVRGTAMLHAQFGLLLAAGISLGLLLHL